MEIKVQNNNHLFTKAVWAIRTLGEDSESGNSQVNQDGTRYIDEVFSATVANPRDRWLSVPGRNSSALAAIGETFWVLAGRNDVEFMQRLLPKNAGKFSDDGVTWRAAYGPRIYAHGQLDSVIDRLRKNPNTRQAYLTIYDPALDSDQGLAETHPEGKAVTKDMVCNFALAFNIKDNKLNMTVFNRSQDVLWGMSTINFIEFSILQEIIAGVLEVELGVYRLVSNNLHFYYNKHSQDQLSQVDVDAGVVEHKSRHIAFRHVNDQNDIQDLFGTVLSLIEDGKPWDDVVEALNHYDANNGLIRDMACALWHRINAKPLDISYIHDEGLATALQLTPADSKYLENNP